MARATLPVGVQTMEIQTDNGILRKEVEIGNRFTIVPIRLSGGAAYVGQPNVPGSLAVVAEPEPVVKPQSGKRLPAKRPPKKTE